MAAENGVKIPSLLVTMLLKLNHNYQYGGEGSVNCKDHRFLFSSLHVACFYLFLYTSYSHGLTNVQLAEGGLNVHSLLSYKTDTLDEIGRHARTVP